MILHTSLHQVALRGKIRRGEIILAGNKQLKIYGSLDCASGKRMKRSNRVFFSSEHEALKAGYRPCGNCLYTKYQAWKKSRIVPT